MMRCHWKRSRKQRCVLKKMSMPADPMYVSPSRPLMSVSSALFHSTSPAVNVPVMTRRLASAFKLVSDEQSWIFRYPLMVVTLDRKPSVLMPPLLGVWPVRMCERAIVVGREGKPSVQETKMLPLTMLQLLGKDVAVAALVMRYVPVGGVHENCACARRAAQRSSGKARSVPSSTTLYELKSWWFYC